MTKPKNPKIRVEMITHRKAIDVTPGMLVGYPDRVEVDVCVKCAAVVFDPIHHDLWHRTLDELV